MLAGLKNCNFFFFLLFCRFPWLPDELSGLVGGGGQALDGGAVGVRGDGATRRGQDGRRVTTDLTLKEIVTLASRPAEARTAAV